MESFYSKILDSLKNHSGFEHKAYKESLLNLKIDERIKKTKTKDSKNYLKFLNDNPEENKKLIDSFHINYSYFFRDPIVFEFIDFSVFPEIIHNNKSLRIWSAGCSSGQEPYSIAILLKEYSKRLNIDFDLHFFATDSNKKIIQKAKTAIYNVADLKECKYKYVDQYFTQQDYGYHLNKSITEKIHYSHDDLLDKNSYAPKDSIFGGFDIVFCRNVLIYFSEEYQDQVIAKLFKSLKKGGFLVLGETESIPPKYKSKLRSINNCTKIYRRVK